MKAWPTDVKSARNVIKNYSQEPPVLAQCEQCGQAIVGSLEPNKNCPEYYHVIVPKTIDCKDGHDMWQDGPCKDFSPGDPTAATQTGLPICGNGAAEPPMVNTLLGYITAGGILSGAVALLLSFCFHAAGVSSAAEIAQKAGLVILATTGVSICSLVVIQFAFSSVCSYRK